MAVIRIKEFGGIVPKMLPRMLPDRAAQTAQDIHPDTSEFRPAADDATTIAATGVSNPKGIYRMQRNADGTLNNDPTTLSTWKVDAGLVSYAKTQVNGDTIERTIKTFDDGSAAPRMIDATGEDRRLGVPPPLNRPEIIITPVDPATTVSSVAYLFTYVTDRGEESAPSLASGVVDVDANDTRELHLPPAQPGHNITHVRVYRSQTGNSSLNYLQILHPTDLNGWPISAFATDTDGFYIFYDAAKDGDLGEPCPSYTWAEPPADFRGIQSMGNGIHVGYSGNTIMPCEPYRPFAYPLPYRKTTSHPIVGTCALDQLLVVGTVGPIKLLYGSTSDQLTEIRHNSGLSVASARSMVAMSSGLVAFASMSGICTVNDAGSFNIVTGPNGADLFSTEDWSALNPSQIFACEWEGHYLFHVPAGFCYCLNLTTGKLTTIGLTGSTFYVDKATDRVYIAQGTSIKALGSGTGRRVGLWRSKRAVMPKPTGWRWLQVNAQFTAAITVRIYRDGTLWHTASVTNAKPITLPASKGLEWEVEIQSAARIEQITLASSTEELQAA